MSDDMELRRAESAAYVSRLAQVEDSHWLAKKIDELELRIARLERGTPDSASPAPKVCPHYDMVIVNEPGCPDCAAETVSAAEKP